MDTNTHEGLTFDDILLLPNYSDFKRHEVDLTTKLHPKIILKLPVISSPMDTVTEDEMAIALAKLGGLGIIQRNLKISKQFEMIRKVKKQKFLVGAAVGIGSDFEERLKVLAKAEADVVVIDSGHGHTKFMFEAVRLIKSRYPNIVVMAGNIATYEGAKFLIKAGADILRVGMGPGSICTTRVITGMGIPQLTAVKEAVRASYKTNVAVIADGGIKQIGDMAKALAFGASAVMLGSLLAGYDESPGKIIKIKGQKYKQYRGMGSTAAMKKGAAERYGQSRYTSKGKLIAEGIESLVMYKGTVSEYLNQIEGSLKSSFYYLGSRNLKEFSKKAKFIKISNATILESHPHSVMLIDGGKNYKKP